MAVISARSWQARCCRESRRLAAGVLLRTQGPQGRDGVLEARKAEGAVIVGLQAADTVAVAAVAVAVAVEAVVSVEAATSTHSKTPRNKWRGARRRRCKRLPSRSILLYIRQPSRSILLYINRGGM